MSHEDAGVALINGVPQRHSPAAATLDVFGHLAGQAQSGQSDLTAQVSVGKRLAGGGDTNGGRGDDALQIRVGLEETLGLVEALLPVIVTIDDCHQFHIGVLRILQLLFHPLDPSVLVGHGSASTENGNLPFVADHLGQHLHLDATDHLMAGRSLVNQASLGRHA